MPDLLRMKIQGGTKMRHLTVEEIIDFISVQGWSEASVTLINRVNGHICNCDACLKRVQAFDLIHEEFQRMGVDMDFNEWLKRDESSIQGLAAVALPKKTPEED